MILAASRHLPLGGENSISFSGITPLDRIFSPHWGELKGGFYPITPTNFYIYQNIISKC
jgi:hypothetical protein